MDNENVSVKEAPAWGDKAIELYGRDPKPSILELSRALQYRYGYESATYECVYRHLKKVSKAPVLKMGWMS